VRPFCPFERGAHLVPGQLGGEHVSLRRPVLAARVARARDTARPGQLRDLSMGVDHRHLAELRLFVGGTQLCERLLRGLSSGEPLEAAPAVAAIA